MSYLNTEVPRHLVAAPLYNTIISCCLHQNKHKVADQCIQAMEQAGVAWDAGTWSLVFKQQVESSCHIKANAWATNLSAPRLHSEGLPRHSVCQEVTYATLLCDIESHTHTETGR